MQAKVNILGTDYEIIRVDDGQDEFMDKMSYGGYCSSILKKIVILNLKSLSDWKNEPENAIIQSEKQTLRHEIVHAFLNESGLQSDSACSDHWAKNEEMIDWFAIQSPRMFEAFKAADCL